MEETSRSKICSFYQDQTILLTGGTGFLGKTLIEKLLRTCSVKGLLVLVREKKGKSPDERIAELFKDPVFEKLLKKKPNAMKTVTGISGDIAEPDLGMSEESRDLIRNKVAVVIHTAATVRFDEKIRDATHINLRGTKLILELCREIINLKAVVHVSTAYSNCPLREIDEKFYEPPIIADHLLSLVSGIPDEKLSEITPILIDKWPNTYTFTKAVTEGLVKEYKGKLPVAIVRPSIIVGAHEEPIKGWIDNLYGPTGMIVGVGAGVLRVLHGNLENVTDIVPIDMVSNAILAVAYETSITFQPDSPIKVYNYVSSPQNPVTYREYMESTTKYGLEIPSEKTLWYYETICTKSRMKYLILAFFLHTIPAIFTDLILSFTSSKLRLTKAYEKIDKAMDLLCYFSLNQWKFHNSNIQTLWSNITEDDKTLFNFDICSVNWDNFFKENVYALRIYIFKETPDSIPRARRRFFWLYLLHRGLQISLALLALWTVTTCISYVLL